MNLSVDIYRNPGEPWGFRLQGGADYRSQLGIKKVNTGSPASRSLRPGDEILMIQNQTTKDMKHKDAENIIRNSGDRLSMTVKRGDDPLFNYRPDGPIKFDVQRAQQAQAQMNTGVSMISTGAPSPQSPGHYYGPPSYPPVASVTQPQAAYMNGYHTPNIYSQTEQTTQQTHYTSYY